MGAVQGHRGECGGGGGGGGTNEEKDRDEPAWTLPEIRDVSKVRVIPSEDWGGILGGGMIAKPKLAFGESSHAQRINRL